MAASGVERQDGLRVVVVDGVKMVSLVDLAMKKRCIPRRQAAVFVRRVIPRIQSGVVRFLRLQVKGMKTPCVPADKIGDLDFLFSSGARVHYNADPNRLTEATVRDMLAAVLGGLTEVPTPDGPADVVTEDEVIEVKHVGNWKLAVGQVMLYGDYFKDKDRRIHLFGKASEARYKWVMGRIESKGIRATRHGN